MQRLIKGFNELFHREKFKGNCLPKNPTTNQINTMASRVAANKECLNILSDILMLKSGETPRKPLSDLYSDIIFDLRLMGGIIKSKINGFPEPVLNIIGDLNELTDKACLVGGGVRDAARGMKPKDFDFVCDVDYDTLEASLLSKGYTVQSEGKQFLVLIASKDGFQFEIANYRKDGTYTDGRRPDTVLMGTLKEDSERRDFTVNAGYFNLKELKLLDPTGQFVEDIETLTLRFVGNPKDRIEEDFLRVFRFYRFISKGFRPDNKSLKACRTKFNESVKTTTPERIRMEIEKMVAL